MSPFADVELVCPRCHSGLVALGDRAFGCTGCGTISPVVAGFAHVQDEGIVRGPDRFMRALYGVFGALHDPGVRYALPFVEGTSESTLRRRLVAWLDLDRALLRSEGGRLRILEVGVGTGANLPYLADALPEASGAVVWGIDLSPSMLRRCARRASSTDLDVRLAVADAHALPFEDGSFDVVFHIGGIGSFRDPARALSEMARVARPGATVVVSDEELEGGARLGVLAHVAFRALTFNQRSPRAPVQAIPPEAVHVELGSLSGFYFVLRFVRA